MPLLVAESQAMANFISHLRTGEFLPSLQFGIVLEKATRILTQFVIDLLGNVHCGRERDGQIV